jgi:hypothetical protein
MANYYNAFAYEFEGITPEERAWIEATLAFDEDDPPDWLLDDCYLGFEGEFGDDTFFVYNNRGDDGAGNLDHLAGFISQFLAKFRPSETVVIEYAAMCTSPRVGGFGGGVLTINKDGEIEEDE